MNSTVGSVGPMPYRALMEPGSIPVAAVITVWRHNSHADVLLSRLLEPAAWRHRTPFALKLASVYADQFPAKGDLCRESCRKHNVPIFSCSQHRYSPGFIGMRNHPEVGDVLGCDVYGGCPTEPHHAELYWHAVHSIETLYTIMGTGCTSVTCRHP